ncbi:efflux RND transporter periplasmic adaptor subunit [Roseivirga sp. BDSF3-8]|uniref:efflux RND transporter periplasmic adaptor subunit n=1 Tax=Roseivirga sp. BDSF3-8 TaxID=3241598 RepID=UPI003531DEB2
MNKKVMLAGLLVILILASGYGLMTYFSNQKELPPQRPKPPVVNHVRVQEVSYSDKNSSVEAFGRLGSSQPVTITAEVSGRLLPGSVSLKRGQSFRKGQLLARIDDTENRLTIQARKSTFLNMIAGILPDLRIDFTDSYEAWQSYFDKIDIEKTLPAIPAVEDPKLKTFLATRNILNEYYSIRSLEERLRKYYIYAPYDGNISEVFLETGSVVNAGGQIARIFRTDKLELEVPIEIRNEKFVKTGSEVVVTDREGETEWEGTILRKAERVDPSTQSINVYINVKPRREAPLYDGMYMKAVIDGETLENVMEIPRKSVFDRNHVYVVSDGVLKKKQIQVVKSNDETYLIRGLEPGEKLVTEAPATAEEDMKVQILQG